MPITRQSLMGRDTKDPLASFRDEFMLPDGVVYLDGNSLGAMPKITQKRIKEVVSKEWAQDLITSWNTHDWFDLPTRLGDKIATLIGAQNGEVLVTDSTGINLYKVLNIVLDLRPERKVILMEGSNFPTDNYVAQGLVRQLNCGLRFALPTGTILQIISHPMWRWWRLPRYITKPARFSTWTKSPGANLGDYLPHSGFGGQRII